MSTWRHTFSAGLLILVLCFIAAPTVHAQDAFDNAAQSQGSGSTLSPSQGSGSTFSPSQGSGSTLTPSQGSGSTFSPSQGSGSTRSRAVIENPLASFGSISGFIEALLRAIIIIGTPIAVLFIILAGLKFVTAQGNPEALSSARQNFVNTLIGIAIFIGGWAIAQLIKATLEQIGVKF